MLVQVVEVAYAYVAEGRWVARCPRLPLGCRNAEHYGADPVTGHVGGLTDTSFRCAHCHLECPAEWPPERAAIEALLAMRPVPMSRQWMPGESLEHLLAENVEHGLAGESWVVPGQGAQDR